jgi:hypothetical protein
MPGRSGSGTPRRRMEWIVSGLHGLACIRLAGRLSKNRSDPLATGLGRAPVHPGGLVIAWPRAHPRKFPTGHGAIALGPGREFVFSWLSGPQDRDLQATGVPFGQSFAFKVMPIVIFICLVLHDPLLPGHHAESRAGLRGRHDEASDLRRRVPAVAANIFIGRQKLPSSSRPTSEDDDVELLTMMTAAWRHISAPCSSYAAWASRELPHHGFGHARRPRSSWRRCSGPGRRARHLRR